MNLINKKLKDPTKRKWKLNFKFQEATYVGKPVIHLYHYSSMSSGSIDGLGFSLSYRNSKTLGKLLNTKDKIEKVASEIND